MIAKHCRCQVSLWCSSLCMGTCTAPQTSAQQTSHIPEVSCVLENKIRPCPLRKILANGKVGQWYRKKRKWVLSKTEDRLSSGTVVKKTNRARLPWEQRRGEIYNKEGMEIRKAMILKTKQSLSLDSYLFLIMFMLIIFMCVCVRVMCTIAQVSEEAREIGSPQASITAIVSFLIGVLESSGPL